MAEYKGLTIRIGGDTSQLNSALKASTKSAAALQAQIRQITRAMRFDPSDFGNLNTRVRLTENRMESLYAKLKLVRNGYTELGKQAVTVGGAATTVKQLAKATENVEMAAKAADKRYEDVTASLAAMYREFEKLGTASIKNALNMDNADAEVEAVIAKFRELGIITKDASKNIDRIKLDLSDAGRVADIDELLTDMRTLGAVTDEQIESNRLMRKTFKEALGNKEAYDAAAQYKKMGVDMQRIRSEAESMASSMREMNTVSRYSANAWSESNAKIKSMDSSLSSCAKQAKAYEAALRENPSNLSAALGRLQALSNEYDLAKGKAAELSRQVEAYKSRLSGVLAEHRNLPQYIQETGDKWQKVQSELLEAKGKADALHQSLQRLKDQQAPTEEIKQLEAAVREADARVDELRQDAARMDEAFETAKECAELQRLQGELTETVARTKSLSAQMDMKSLAGRNFLNASTIKSAGMSLYSTLTPAITMLGWRAVTAAQDIDSAYRDMRKTVEGTEGQFESLRQAAIDFSKTHVTSADQMLNIMAIGGELGVATDSLQAFAETVSNLDVATNLDTETAASSLGKLANITHMTADQYDNYSDALVRLGNNGASTEDQIVDIATRIGSMGTIVGMTVPEILALSSSIASTGMKTEASGTAIANTISDMESAVAKGGDALDAFASVSGMSAKEFADTWESEPIAAFKAFVEGLNEIEQSGGSADATLEELGITGTRQKQAIEGLMQTIGGLNDNLTMSRDAWEGQSDAWGAAGDAAREAEKKAEGFSGQLAILSNIGNDAMAALAEGATPIISLFTDLAKSALDMFETMDDGTKTTIVALLGIGAAIGPILTLSATFVTAKQNISKFITETSAMGKALSMAKQGFVGMGDAMGPPVPKMIAMKNAAKELGKSLLKNLAAGAVVAGVAVIIAAISDYLRKMQEFETATQNAGDTLTSVFDGMSSNADRAFGDTAKSFDSMVSEFAKHNEAIRKSAEETYGNAALVEDYGQALQDALSAYNEGDRGQESLAKLKTALDLYNGAAGESITLTEDETGALQLMKDDAILTADAFGNLSKSIINASKAKFFEEAYTQKYADEREALDALTEAQKKQQEAQEAFLNNTDGSQAQVLADNLAAANNELARAQELYGSTAESANQYKEGMELMAEAQLENASAAVRWVAENDALQASIWQNGESVTDFAHYLNDLGVSYDDMVSNAEGITDLASTWDGSLGSMIAGLKDMGYNIDLDSAAIQGLNAIQINGKTYYIDDKGTILDQEGKLSKLQSYEVFGKTYIVDDNGTVYDSMGRVQELTGAIESIPLSTEPSVTASVYGADAVYNLLTTLGSLVASPWRVKVQSETTQSATGSIASSPFIPRHARGYIAAGPTLTNNGWVGEAGAEAVLNWGTGGAVIPLTNHRYMEPIAAAIAKNMQGPSGSEPISVNVTVNAHTDADPNEIAAVTARKVKQIFMARGR